MKNCETKQEALDYFKKYLKKEEKNNSYSPSILTQAIHLIKAMEASPSISEVVSELKLEFEKMGADDSFLYSSSTYSNILLFTESSKSYRIPVDRLFVRIGDSENHLFSLFEDKFSTQQFIDLSRELSKYKFVSELVYEYLTFKKLSREAGEVIKNIVDKSDDDLMISSTWIRDYIPLLDYLFIVKKNYPKTIEKTLQSYLEVYYTKKSDKDSEFNNRLYKNFKRELRKTNFSNFSMDRHSYNIKDDKDEARKNLIDPIDLIESSIAYRREFLNLKDWESTSALREMIKRDVERIKNLIVSHFNSEHRNGVRKSAFLRSYRKISNYVKIDAFKLDPKLQSYVLLEEIG
jgi:hypothetical protein